MKTLEYRFYDRSAWTPGPWMDEPDKVQWQDETSGLPCIAKRNRYGIWCGYVGVVPGHKYFECGYDDLDVEVHGGLTYADHCEIGDPASGICHVPEEGEPDHIWWLGFDCGHYMDAYPDWSPMARVNIDGHYRTLDYVKGQCAELARQLEQA